jgi:hypothetical protein
MWGLFDWSRSASRCCLIQLKEFSNSFISEVISDSGPLCLAQVLCICFRDAFAVLSS